MLILAQTAVALIWAGCASGGMFASGHITDVQLQKNNFEIVARDLVGESKAGYVLGVSISTGMSTETFALFRASGTGRLYQEALASLWKNVEKSCGALQGRKLALINVRYDAEALNFLLYTEPRVTVRADVVEFTE